MALVSIRIERRPRAASASRPGVRRFAAFAAATAVVAGVLAVGFPASAVDIHPVAAQTVFTGSTTTIAPHTSQIGQASLGWLSGPVPAPPSDATYVQLQVSVSDATANGTLKIRPYGLPTGVADQQLKYVAGDTDTGTFVVRLGIHDKLRFANSGSSSITVAAFVTGYSTQVVAGDIATDGGSPGQVLTDTGSSASWQPVGHAYGVANPIQYVQLDNNSQTTVASVDVPSGSYVVNFTLSVGGDTGADPDYVGCFLYSPDNTELTAQYGNSDAANPQSSISGEGLVTTTGGTITLTCVDSTGADQAVNTSLIATAVGTVTGFHGGLPPHALRAHMPTAH